MTMMSRRAKENTKTTNCFHLQLDDCKIVFNREILAPRSLERITTRDLMKNELKL